MSTLADFGNFSKLNEESDEVVWKGQLRRPTHDQIEAYLKGLFVRPFDAAGHPPFTVYKTLNHAIRWMDGFIDIEYSDLKESFANASKTFQILVIRSSDHAEIDIVFRLSTLGHPGYTQYRIAARRVEADLFACNEQNLGGYPRDCCAKINPLLICRKRRGLGLGTEPCAELSRFGRF